MRHMEEETHSSEAFFTVISRKQTTGKLVLVKWDWKMGLNEIDGDRIASIWNESWVFKWN